VRRDRSGPAVLDRAAAAILAALLVLFVHRRASDALVLVVAGSAAGVVLIYRYLDLGPILGLPDMYEPVWFSLKTLATAAQVLAALAVLVLLLGSRRPAVAATHP